MSLPRYPLAGTVLLARFEPLRRAMDAEALRMNTADLMERYRVKKGIDGRKLRAQNAREARRTGGTKEIR